MILKKIVQALSIIIVIVLMSACKKLPLAAVNGFTVSASATTVKAGSPVTFTFTGNPDVITFYSGEAGKKYENSSRTSADGMPTLQFNTTHTAGTDQNSLTLLASTNFNGVYDSTDVKNSTWTDITNRAKLASNSTSTPSGTIDLSDFLATSPQVYIAFKSVSKTSTWNVSSLTVNNNIASDNSVQLVADINSASFINVNFLNPAVSWKLASSVLSVATAAGVTPSVNWAVSKSLVLNYAVPNVGVSIKNITQVTSPYTYTFNTAGTYTVTFAAANVNTSGSTQDIEQITIVVTP